MKLITLNQFIDNQKPSLCVVAIAILHLFVRQNEKNGIGNTELAYNNLFENIKILCNYKFNDFVGEFY